MYIQNKLENAQSNFYYRRASRENYDRPRVLLKYGFIPLPSEFYACQAFKETKNQKPKKQQINFHKVYFLLCDKH